MSPHVVTCIKWNLYLLQEINALEPRTNVLPPLVQNIRIRGVLLTLTTHAHTLYIYIYIYVYIYIYMTWCLETCKWGWKFIIICLCVIYSEYCNKFMGSIISHLIDPVKFVIDMTAAPASTTITTVTSPVNDDRKLIYSFHFWIPFTCWYLPLRSYSCSFLSSCRYSSPRNLATALDSLCVSSLPAAAIVSEYCY